MILSDQNVCEAAKRELMSVNSDPSLTASGADDHGGALVKAPDEVGRQLGRRIVRTEDTAVR